MSNFQIIVMGVLFFSLTLLAFFLTVIEFIKMDKNPDHYLNPRANPKRSRSTRKASPSKK